VIIAVRFAARRRAQGDEGDEFTTGGYGNAENGPRGGQEALRPWIRAVDGQGVAGGGKRGHDRMGAGQRVGGRLRVDGPDPVIALVGVEADPYGDPTRGEGLAHELEKTIEDRLLGGRGL